MSLPVLRLSIACACMVLLAVAESLWPRRPWRRPRRQRWFANLSLQCVNTVIASCMGGLSAVHAAIFAADYGWGVLHGLALPLGLQVPLTVIVLDLIIYGQHVLFHRVPLLWRLHAVHHTDTELDFSSAVRFHPLEIVLSVLVKVVAVLLLGLPLVGVILFEIILNTAALWNHANLYIPKKWERCLRKFVVTPDMHRVHHSVSRVEMNGNFGFFLSCWDRLFATYLWRPLAGHQRMKIGLADYQHAGDDTLRLSWMLRAPLFLRSHSD